MCVCPMYHMGHKLPEAYTSSILSIKKINPYSFIWVIMMSKVSSLQNYHNHQVGDYAIFAFKICDFCALLMSG